MAGNWKEKYYDRSEVESLKKAIKSLKIVVERSGWYQNSSFFYVESIYNVIRPKQPIQWRDFFNKLTFYCIIDKDLLKQEKLLRSKRS